jgi:hypothetical protein
MSYPVPPPLKQPKHLFHLILQGAGGDTSITDICNQLSAQNCESKENSKAPSKSEAAKAPGAGGSFAFILRYEGDGIIDDTVADVVTKLYKLSAEADSHASTPTGSDLLGAVMASFLAKSPQAPPSPPTAAGNAQPPGPLQAPATPGAAQKFLPPAKRVPAATAPPRR